MSAQNTSETSTSKHNWFLRYTFNPDLYRFHGLAIDDLPYVCKRYIDQHPAILAQPETCTRQCAELILTLWDDLEDRDTAILAIRREFRAVILQVREVDKLHGKHALRFFKARQREIDDVRDHVMQLLISRRKILKHFVQLFDALLWAELNDRDNLTGDDCQRLRCTMLQPIIKRADSELQNLENAFNVIWDEVEQLVPSVQDAIDIVLPNRHAQTRKDETQPHEETTTDTESGREDREVSLLVDAHHGMHVRFASQSDVITHPHFVAAAMDATHDEYKTRIDGLPREAIDGLIAAGVEPFQRAKSPRYPYPFNGKQINELPQRAIDHLVLVGKSYGLFVPPASHAAAQQYSLITRLFDTLAVIDNIIVASRHDATNVPPKRGSQTRTHTWWPRALQRDDPHIRQIVERLLPERMRVVKEFVELFDALVWIEPQDGTLPASAVATLRDVLLYPVLDRVDGALTDVQRFVERGWRPRPKIYTDLWAYRAVEAFQEARDKYFAPLHRGST
ncbi:predicted protein [Postia placenta Mad-698-R]|nr:predicted protein [Postia placenta Mad-698-R]